MTFLRDRKDHQFQRWLRRGDSPTNTAGPPVGDSERPAGCRFHARDDVVDGVDRVKIDRV